MATGKAKLHELLAVESSLRNQAEVTRNDLINTFDKKRSHFAEIRQTYVPKAVEEKSVEEVKQTIQTSVDKELEWVSEKLAKVLDIGYQIDLANTQARADVVLDDDRTILTGIPATQLLQLEKRLAEVHALINAIPTLDPAKGFTEDPQRPEGTFVARDVIRENKEKVFSPVIMVQATDKFPAQVEKLFVDKVVGNTTIQEWSTFITVERKGKMLDRLESLTRAVKQARSRANDLEFDVRGNKIGEKILAYIFNGPI